MQIDFKLPEIKWVEIGSIFLNEANPRKITDEKFSLLVKNIRKFPKMMGVRPVVVDQKGVIRGGNMRYRGCQSIGWEKIPVISFDESWTEEEMKMFVVADNQGFGIWDYEILSASYDVEDLFNLGFDEKDLEIEKPVDVVGEIDFTTELLEENNYIVFSFDNTIDFQSVEQIFDLKSVHSLDSVDGYERKGTGRVINGKELLKKIHDNSNS